MIAARKLARLGLAPLGIFVALGAAALPLAATAAASGDEGNHQQARQLFNDWSCGSCHVLQDAGASGHVGPSLDGNPNLNREFVVSRITNGQGAMPGFGGQLSEDEIELLAEYIVKVGKK